MSPASRLALSFAVVCAVYAAQQRGCVPAVLPHVPSDRLIDAPGVAVLVVYQDRDLTKYTQEQRDVISGALWADGLDAGAWRIVDADAKFTGDSPFRAAFESIDKSNLPWAVISGPGSQYQGPLPPSPADMAQRVVGARDG